MHIGSSYCSTEEKLRAEAEEGSVPGAHLSKQAEAVSAVVLHCPVVLLLYPDVHVE
jgi:hypothetical protein